MAPAKRSRLTLDARREQLVELGTEIFAERPFDEISIEDIAVAAGISKGLLYHYFPSKRDFYVEVVRQACALMEHETATDPALAALERVEQGVERYLDYVAGHARGYSTVLRAGIGADPEVLALVEASRGRMAERILAGVAQGEEPPALLRLAVRGWVGFAEAAALDWLEHGGAEREDLRELLVQTLLGALRTAGELDARAPAPA
ncbi:MAG TPA: TetR/AcrR family transcriptional regulator [Solirubrobacteraceae bacterium]|nr:TetR/AcrR family transcriptional regulator [Solirubrobacteraceae bacterium]